MTESPWLRPAQLAAYLGLPSRDAARMWAKRAGVIGVRRPGGRAVWYAKADVDLALTGTRPSRLRVA